MKLLRVTWVVACIGVPAFALPPPLAGKSPALVHEKQCDQCHGFDFQSDKSLAPNLRYAGEKFQPTWLQNYLSEPDTLRPSGYILSPGFLNGKEPKPHPTVSTQEAKTLTDYLITLKYNTEESPIDFEPLAKGKLARAKIKFERDYGCISCHQAINLAGKPRGGVSGPSLVNAGNRLNPSWIYRWLTNPRAYEIKSRMPIFQIIKEDAVVLVQYIMTLKKNMLR